MSERGGQSYQGESRQNNDEVEQDAAVTDDRQEAREKLKQETDDLLDDIDDVLESNAQAFVDAYVQKGGQ